MFIDYVELLVVVHMTIHLELRKIYKGLCRTYMGNFLPSFHSSTHGAIIKGLALILDIHTCHEEGPP